MAQVSWTTINGVSLAIATRKAGFDLALYDKYSADVQKELRKRTIHKVMKFMDQQYEFETEEDFHDVNRAVYVICVGWPFTIDYKNSRSRVLYVGIGTARNRILNHFKRENGLFDLMLSLQGVDFTFYISEPRAAGSKNLYKHIEFMLLERFAETNVGGDFPLLNKNAGSDKGSTVELEGWDKPLMQNGQRPQWVLTPTDHNKDFAKLD